MKLIFCTLRPLLRLVVLLALTAVAWAEAGPTPAWSVDHLLSAEWVGDWKISPDSQWVAWIKVAPDKAKNEYVCNLFLSGLTTDKQIQLTRGSDGCSSPKWSPDGRLIAFLSSRPDPKVKADAKDKAKIWLMDPFEGEPWALTADKRPVSAFDWDGADRIVFTMAEELPKQDSDGKDKEDRSQIIEDEAQEPAVCLFGVDLKSTNVTRLTDNKDRIGEFAVSPDRTQVVAIHNRSLRYSYDRSLGPVTVLTNLKTGQRKQVFTEAGFPVSHFRWQRDGKTVYAIGARSSSPKYDYPAIMEVYRYDTETGVAARVDLDWEKGLASQDLEITDQGFVTMLADGVQPRPARYFLADGRWRREWITGIHATNLFMVEIGRDGRTLLYSHSTASRPSAWYRATLNHAAIESPRQLISLNPQLQGKETARCEIVHWKGALGETVEGLLYYPLGYEPGKKYPLVVEIHGGPAWLIQDQWWDFPLGNNNRLNARGLFVFRPNYHGSAGYGLKWAESIIGRYGELEVEDINKGVDYLIERGLADPQKLALTGWSNGGTLTAAATIATNRYKAAIAGGAPIDWIDYWAKSDFGAWFCARYMEKSPLDHPSTLIRHSPFYQLNEVTTPTLILFGSDDKRVPVEQGWMYYRALQQSGKADVRFVVFPGEAHGPSKLAYLKRAMEEELGWLDKYLLNRRAE